MKYQIYLNVECERTLYSFGGKPEKKANVNFQVYDNKRNLIVVKSFVDVTPAQAARAVALQNKLAGRK